MSCEVLDCLDLSADCGFCHLHRYADLSCLIINRLGGLNVIINFT